MQATQTRSATFGGFPKAGTSPREQERRPSSANVLKTIGAKVWSAGVAVFESLVAGATMLLNLLLVPVAAAGGFVLAFLCVAIPVLAIAGIIQGMGILLESLGLS